MRDIVADTLERYTREDLEEEVDITILGRLHSIQLEYISNTWYVSLYRDGTTKDDAVFSNYKKAKNYYDSLKKEYKDMIKK